MSVTMVLHEFGVSVSELDVVSRAYEHGWLAGEPGNWQGMPPAQAEDLLESYGVPAHLETFPDGTQAIDALRERLDAGFDAVLAIDSSEVWEGVDDDLTLGGDRLDHAVVVTEVDDQAGTVTLNDPGHPEGAGMVVDLAQFTDAWEDSDFQMVVTDQAPTGQLPAEPEEIPQSAPETPLPQPIPIGPDTGAPAGEPGSEPPIADTTDEPAQDGDGIGEAPLVIGAGGLILLPIYLIAREARKRRETT
jgi:hypothetical protein